MLTHLFKIFAFVVVTSAASILQSYDVSKAVDINSLPTPDQLALDLTENEFDDYLDYWLQQQYLNSAVKDKTTNYTNSCTIPILNLKEPLPVYFTDSGLLRASGTSGNIVLSQRQNIKASCEGSGLLHSSSPNNNPSTASLTCNGGTLVESSWTSSVINFIEIFCLKHPIFNTVTQNVPCQGGGIRIDAILTADQRQFSILTSCFHKANAEVFYVEYEQTPENFFSQINVARPLFEQGTHFPNLNVDQLYSQKSQQSAFDVILGSNMNTKYINATFFLARGHLAAKTDYVLAAEQRATFTFVNAAPQWQPFNAGNWNTLEQNLRSRIGNAGYRTKIYTGTYGILRLADSSNVLRDIYLSPKTKQIPVPMWFYKVVHEPSTGKGVAYLGLNNPHVSLAEAQKLAFCTDVCVGNAAFSWLKWKPSDIRLGYSICCKIDDFRNTVTTLPAFKTTDILA